MKLYEYAGLDATGLAALVRGGEVTAREVAAVATEAIALANPKINAVVETYDDRIATKPACRSPVLEAWASVRFAACRF